MKLLSKIKYTTLKVIDISGLTFLSPVVLLCYGEQPKEQLRKIFQWIVVPALAILAAWCIYDWVARKVDTKSGSLPVVSEIFESYKGVNKLHVREKLKERAYSLSGDERLELMRKVEAELSVADAAIQTANEEVEKYENLKAEELERVLGPVQEKYKRVSDELRAESKERELIAKKMASNLTVGEDEGYEALLGYIRETKKIVKEKTVLKNQVRKERGNIEQTSFPVYAAAKRKQTEKLEDKAFLESYLKLLSSENKSVVVGEKLEKIASLKSGYAMMIGDEAYKQATSIVREESGVEKKQASSYAGIKTIWFQVQRSILCVFAGFLIGSLIAIPIGILCGLNKTFMAAMTPFIAVFKPVSPIVWLPIVLIVVNAFFPDPDTHPVMKFLWDLPILGTYKLNPAFIASAITVALCSLWATMANTALGVASIDKDHMNVAKVLKLGFGTRLVKIIIPSSLPLIFAGLRISLGVGWMVLIAAELLSTSEGVGKFVIDEFNNGSSESLAKLIVVVFIVGIIGLLLDRIMVVFQRMVSFEGSAATV